MFTINTGREALLAGVPGGGQVCPARPHPGRHAWSLTSALRAGMVAFISAAARAGGWPEKQLEAKESVRGSSNSGIHHQGDAHRATSNGARL